jgi:hypothetical protein
MIYHKRKVATLSAAGFYDTTTFQYKNNEQTNVLKILYSNFRRTETTEMETQTSVIKSIAH